MDNKNYDSVFRAATFLLTVALIWIGILVINWSAHALESIKNLPLPVPTTLLLSEWRQVITTIGGIVLTFLLLYMLLKNHKYYYHMLSIVLFCMSVLFIFSLIAITLPIVPVVIQ